MKDREQKVTPELLARLFQERYYATNQKAGIEQPKWDDMTPDQQMVLVEVMRQLQGLFVQDTEPGALWVSSIVSHKTHEGIVQIQFGATGGQVSVYEARQIAQQFMQAAEAAETDALIYKMLNGFESTQGEQMAINLIVRLRDLRDEAQKQKLNNAQQN